MYEDLVKDLRELSHEFYLDDSDDYTEGKLSEAADAIEELQKAVYFHKYNSEFWEDKYNSLADERWIPVTERLPEEKTYVLILFDTIAGKMSGVCFLYKDDDGHNCWTWLDRIGKNLFDIQPTHWMPLPQPPKEET